MRKAAFIISLFILSLFSLLSCSEKIKIQKLSVKEGKKFDKLYFNKVWEASFYIGQWCLACPNGVVCHEVLDKGYKEYKFNLYNYSGNLVRERKLLSGEGPNDIKIIDLDSVWISSSGIIHCVDTGYLKTIDPETLEIKTIVKLSNVIDEYGSKYTFGRHGGTSIEEKDNKIITSFESSAFYSDFIYYIITCNSDFRNLSVVAKAKKEKPWAISKLEERKKVKGKIEDYIDYYHKLRFRQIFSVDWKRGIVYIIPAIESPEIECVRLDGKRREKYLIDINPKNFKVEKDEFEFWYKVVSDGADPIIKKNYNFILSIPSHAPALMGIHVMNDWLLIITGNRNWQKDENEVLVYRLADFHYEGSFFIPFPAYQEIKFYDNYYITKDLMEKGDGYEESFEIFRIEEK